MVKNKVIASYVVERLPMLYDEGKKGKKQPNKPSYIRDYDCTTILASIMSIGELTNMSTTWKDIAENPAIMERMGLNEKLIDNNVCILRFSQGTSIDYAKTGYFFQPPKYAMTLKSPTWKPWSRSMAEVGIKGAEVYRSNSQMGRLHRAVNKYLKETFKNEIKDNTRDFTFEFTDNVDYEEMLAVKPIIAELENNYRNELRVLHDMGLDEDQQKEYITFIMDKYQTAMTSIDADMRSIAAAAYIHTYYESSSKSNKISFPWITCFEGLLLNLSETTEKSLKLRRTRFTGHIDDIPKTIKIYRNKAVDEDYTVDVKAPNGTYETFKKFGALYIVMASKSLAKKQAKKVFIPKEKSITFQINSFSHNDSSATEVLELLKENDGIVRIRKTKDIGHKVNSLHAGVWIGDKRVGNVNRQNKHTVLPYIQNGAAEFKVVDLDTFSPTYVPATGKNADKEMEHKFFTMTFLLQEMIETEVAHTSADNPSEEMYQTEDTGVPVYSDDDVPAEERTYTASVDIDIDADGGEEDYDEIEEDDPIAEFDPSIVRRFNTDRAPYWEQDIMPASLHIVGGSVERIGALKVGEPCIKVSLTAENKGKSATVDIIIIPQRGYFEFDSSDRKINEKVKNLALQMAHYEIYMEKVIRKQA